MASPLLRTKLFVPRPRREPGAASPAERTAEPDASAAADAGLGAARVRQDDAAGRVAGRCPVRSARWRGCRWRRASGSPTRSGPTWSPRSTPRRQASGHARCRCSRHRTRRSRPSSPPCSTSSAHCPPGSTWCSTTTTSPTVRRSPHGVAFLLEHLPPDVHLVISTRADPDLPLARLRARGELVEVRAADLRFTLDEVAAYLNEVIGLDLDSRGHRRSGGAHRGLDRRPAAGGAVAPGPRRRRRLHRRLRRGRPVRRRLPRRGGARPSAGRRTDASCSRPRSWTGSAAPCATPSPGGPTAGRVLEMLDRSNLFVVPLDDSRQWYRYHHLFADVLRTHLLEERPGEVADLHRRAGQWYAAAGEHGPGGPARPRRR